jgi:ornithine carbamoyltransferase
VRKDFLTLDDIKRREILEIIKSAEKLKKKPVGDQLNGKIFCLYFEEPSIQSRISFMSGIQQLEGKMVFLRENISQLNEDENVKDIVKVLERYVDVIIGRVFSHETLETLSTITNIHIINAMSDLSHPCQVLSDLFTIKERFGEFKGLKLAYIGDGNNICNSLLLGCSKMGIDISIACPEEFQPNTDIIHKAVDYTKITKSDVDILEDPVKAVKDANIIYSDVFLIGNKSEKEKRKKIFLPKYQVTRKLMNFAADKVLFMHSLPANRGEEVAYDVIDGSRSIVIDQAENRLHVQKALLTKIVKK